MLYSHRRGRIVDRKWYLLAIGGLILLAIASVSLAIRELVAATEGQIISDIREAGKQRCTGMGDGLHPRHRTLKSPDRLIKYLHNEDEELRYGSLWYLRKAHYRKAIPVLRELARATRDPGFLSEIYSTMIELDPANSLFYLQRALWMAPDDFFEQNALLITRAITKSRIPCPLPVKEFEDPSISLQKKEYVLTVLKSEAGISDIQVALIEEAILSAGQRGPGTHP